MGDSTTVKGVSTVGHPVLSSTRMHHDIITPGQHVPNPATTSLGIGRGARAVSPRTPSSTYLHTDTFSPMQHKSDESISSLDLITQLAHQIGERIANQLQKTASSHNDKSTPTPSTNLGEGLSKLTMTGVKFVMQVDVKEPPHFRGDGTDRHTRDGARDVVKVSLCSIPSLKPDEDPKLVFDILKQHFSEVTYSSMPLADFYNT